MVAESTPHHGFVVHAPRTEIVEIRGHDVEICQIATSGRITPDAAIS
ncbi:hypothetical protein J2X72_004550 [Phyllobacterium sp. 1468]|nr:hypothetical protein [Phyllobacterium sp. 1468]